MDARGIDVTVFSPRASAMAHHVGDAAVSLEWSRRCNDLVHRVATLFPDRFAPWPSCRSRPGRDLTASIAELRRCVEELGFVGVNLNPDPSGGLWTSPPLTDRYWYPFYEAMIELDVPAMVHVSASATPVFHAHRRVLHQRRHHGLHAAAAGQPLRRPARACGWSSRTAGERCPTTGAATAGWPTCSSSRRSSPTSWATSSSTPASTTSRGSTCCSTSSTPANILFGSEMVGAVRGIDDAPATTTTTPAGTSRRRSRTGRWTTQARAAVFEGNVRRVYPRLAGALGA